MTDLPPAFPQYPPLYGQPYGRPRPTNGWAVASLVCGIIGCAGITPLIAIVAGLIGIGRARQAGGRGMAVTGILLGVLWLFVFTGGGIFGYFVYEKAVAFLASTKPQTLALINHVEAGNVTPDGTTGTLTAAQLQAVAEKAKPLGACQSITTSDTAFNKTNGLVEASFSGVAGFEHGSLPIHVRMRADNAGGRLTWVFEQVELQ